MNNVWAWFSVLLILQKFLFSGNINVVYSIWGYQDYAQGQGREVEGGKRIKNQLWWVSTAMGFVVTNVFFGSMNPNVLILMSHAKKGKKQNKAKTIPSSCISILFLVYVVEWHLWTWKFSWAVAKPDKMICRT